MRVLVTGGAGFIGSHVADELLRAGHQVTVLDDLSSGKRENVPSGARFICADIRSREAREAIVAGAFDAVVHHAAQIDVRRSVEQPGYDADVNLMGLLNLLEASVQAHVRRFVFASSGGACYGEQQSFPATENHPLQPVSPYGVSKAASELYLGYYFTEKKLPYVALRYSNVYGPRQDPAGEAGVVAIFSGRCLAGTPCTIYGDGRQTRDYVYVSDVARANVLALASEYIGPLNIGTGVETDVVKLHDEVAKAAGSHVPPTFAPPRPGEQRRSCVDPGLAGRVLGWRPEVELRRGIEMTVEYFRHQRPSAAFASG